MYVCMYVWVRARVGMILTLMDSCQTENFQPPVTSTICLKNGDLLMPTIHPWW